MNRRERRAEAATFRRKVGDIAAGAGGVWRVDMQFADERPTEDRELLALLDTAVQQTLAGGRMCLSCDREFSAARLPWALGAIRPLQPGAGPSGIGFGLCRPCCNAGHASIPNVTAKLRKLLFSDLREVPLAAVHLDGGRA